MTTQITTAMIADLRERTGAGILECKKALTATNGNIDEAIKALREKGLANASKKASNIAADGLIALDVSADGKNACIAEINCQTDFVAKGNDFIQIAREIFAIYQSANTSNVDEVLSVKSANGSTLEEILKSAIAKTGENIKLRRGEKVSVNGFVSSYVHNAIDSGLGKIGVLLAIETQFADKQKLSEFGKKICMHIASMNPLSLDESGVPASAIENEKQIFIAQAKQTGKPDNVIEKMVEGRIKKFLAESVLLNQTFVMDNKITIADFVNQFAKEVGQAVKIKSFTIFKLGEGIEKKEEDFAAEVASMTNNK